MASLIKKPNGWYYAQFFDATRRPKKKQLSLKTQRRRIAEQVLKKIEDSWKLGDFDPWRDVSDDQSSLLLGSAIQAFLDTRANLSPYTIAKYQSVLGLLEKFLGTDYPLRQILANDVQAFLNGSDRKAVTRKTYSTTLGPFFRWLMDEGAVKESPITGLRLQRVPQKFPRFLTPKDVEYLVAAIDGGSLESKHAPEGTSRWLIPIVRANVYLGLRAGEVVNLCWKHVDMDRALLTVANTESFGTKSGRDRTIPICTRAYEIMSGLEHQSKYVFPSFTNQRLGRGYLSARFKHFARKAGLAPEINFHTTRHTACSWLAMQGVSVEAIRLYAGHSSIAVTQKYMHLSPDVFRDQIERAFDKVA